MSIFSETTFSFHSLNSAVRKTILLQCLRMNTLIYQSILYLNKPLRVTVSVAQERLKGWSCLLPEARLSRQSCGNSALCLGISIPSCTGYSAYGMGDEEVQLSSNMLCKDRCFHLTQTLELGHYRMPCTRKITISGYAWTTNWRH